MKIRYRGEGQVRRPPTPNAPTVEVIFGGDHDSSSVGLLRVSVPPGAAMGEHAHQGSDVIVTPLAGQVIISQGNIELTVAVGDSILILKDEKVGLRNEGADPTQVLVSAGPADFAAGVLSWPSAE